MKRIVVCVLVFCLLCQGVHADWPTTRPGSAWADLDGLSLGFGVVVVPVGDLIHGTIYATGNADWVYTSWTTLWNSHLGRIYNPRVASRSGAVMYWTDVQICLWRPGIYVYSLWCVHDGRMGKVNDLTVIAVR